MAARLGQVLYWLACAVAASIVGLTAVASSTGTTPAREAAIYVGVAAALSALIWLVGRAIRYILAGN